MKGSKRIEIPIIIMFWSIPSINMLDIYKEKSNLLRRAMKESKTVEILTYSNKLLKLKEIGNETGQFFGFDNIKGKMQKLFLNINDIKKIILL